ncbi:MAG: class I SAM-dependent methyltransferase [Capsulimonas sp.]|uniref:SAM-dependent methyltransferase n=1 Tax=Capsulimonas sp. TaxID=2494211 RepID=UPI0032667CB4
MTQNAAPLCVTTGVNGRPEIQERARQLAHELGAVYYTREKRNIPEVLTATGANRVLVVTHTKLVLRERNTDFEYAFHPNLAMLRGYNVTRGWRDLYVEAAALQPGESVLDCTLGFAGEAALAALMVGELGTVVGLESVPELAAVTRDGVSRFELEPKVLEDAMRRIQVVTADYRDYLRQAPDSSFDLVYFDPFFDERLPGSENSVSPLALFGNSEPLDPASIHEARRVARRRVVIKHPRHEPLPPEIESLVMESVTGRKSRVVYKILPAVEDPIAGV